MVSSVKVYKKTAPNGKITVYVGRRDFVDTCSTTEPLDGVVVCEDDYLRGRKIFASVTITYRFGREEDEMMGLHFSKDLQVACVEVPLSRKEGEVTELQERLIKKLGVSAYPFFINIPDNAPCSVQLFSDKTSKPLGVIYDLRLFVADNPEEKPHRRNSVSLAVRKVQFAPSEKFLRQPSALASKGFTFSSGKVNMEVSLDREMYYHGETISPTVCISNNSNKTVRGIKVAVMQHVEVTMINNQFSREVASFETKEGFPLIPGDHFRKVFTILPLASNTRTFGVALDGKVKDADANLASSTLKHEDTDSLGIVVSYSVQVELDCGALAGNLSTSLPFKLMHPIPGEAVSQKEQLPSTGPGQMGRAESVEIEEFSRFRRGMSVDTNLD